MKIALKKIRILIFLAIVLGLYYLFITVGKPPEIITKATEIKDISDKPVISEKKALYYAELPNKKVLCQLCPHQCLLGKGRTGKCRVRKNRGGNLYNIMSGKTLLFQTEPTNSINLPLTLALDIPMLHIGGIGCSMRCAFCYLADPVLGNPNRYKYMHTVSAEEIISTARKNHIRYIVLTFNEPTTSYEDTLRIAELAKKSGLVTIMNTNGYLNPQPFVNLIQHMDIVLVSLKGFSQDFYQKYTESDLAPILYNLKLLKRHQVKTEIIYLLIPGLNDSPQEIRKMSLWIKNNIGKYTPVHFIRYYPAYKLSAISPTPLDSIQRSITTARAAGLKYVVPYAHLFTKDKSLLIKTGLNKLKCPYCNRTVLEFNLDRGKKIYFKRFLRKDHTCQWCGKEILNLYKQ